MQEILLVTSDVLNVERVGYWRFREDPPGIVCELAYQAGGQRYERGLVLRESDAAPYLRAVRKAQVMAVEDARVDPRTSCLIEYLDTNRIGSLLDTAIRTSGEPIGILCLEHVGPPRSWSSREQEFAFAVTQILSLRIEGAARSEAEDHVRRAHLLADVSAAMSETFEPEAAARLATQGAVPAVADFAAVLAYDGKKVRRLADSLVRHLDSPTLESLWKRRSFDLDGTGFVAHAMRERQTLFLPRLTDELAMAYGFSAQDVADLRALGIRSMIAVPFVVRGVLTGAMIFATTKAPYHQVDAEFAERYAYRVAVLMENALLYQKAQDAIRVRDEFLTMASHELRTPITSLHLLAERLAHRASQMSSSTIASVSDRIVGQAARLERMVARLLDSCEIGAGRPSIERARTDLTRVVDDVAHAFAISATRAGSELVVGAPRDPVIGCWDPLRIEQIVANLVDNAIKFGGGKPIHIDVEKKDGAVRLLVRDEGPGISDEDAKHVFDRYWRAPTTRNHGGLGLGLYVAKEMAEAHGGTIALDSLPGEGATFTLELPIGDPPRESIGEV